MWQRAVMLATLAVAGCANYGSYGDLYNPGPDVGGGIGYAAGYSAPDLYGGSAWWRSGECCGSRELSPGELVACQHQFNTQVTAQQQLYNSQVRTAQERYNQQATANPSATPVFRQQLNAQTSAAERQLQAGIHAARRLDFGN